MRGRGPELLAAARPAFDGSALTFDLPAASPGTLLLVVIARAGAVVAPAGWTQVEATLGAGTLFLDVWARLAGDGDEAAATWTTASSQELQGQLLVLTAGTPAVIRETSATSAFVSTTRLPTPAASSTHATNLFVAVHSAAGVASLTPPDGWATIDAYDSSVVADRTFSIAARRADVTGSITPPDGDASPASTGRAWSLVLRERPPIVPLELVDPVPGNIGLLPS